MITPKIKAILHRARSMLKRDPDRFLREVSGVIHVCANTGQERKFYSEYGLRVIWIEPIPEVFEKLKENVADFSQQRALKCLVTDQDNVAYQFHIANNEGHSSSILDLNLHKDIWPQVAYEKTITLRSKTLPSLLEEEHVDYSEYDSLIMDTQGSELLVLKGAVSIIPIASDLFDDLPAPDAGYTLESPSRLYPPSTQSTLSPRSADRQNFSFDQNKSGRCGSHFFP